VVADADWVTKQAEVTKAAIAAALKNMEYFTG
jgi:hypothetical protein